MNEENNVRHDHAENAAQFTSAVDCQAYCIGGDAKLTLVSKRTGVRFTYRITRAPENKRFPLPAYFVSVLTGPDNETNYRFFGTMRGAYNLLYRYSDKAKVSETAPSVKAFAWFFDRVFLQGVVPAELEIWHEGRCSRCHKPLTDPESIRRGLGPICAEKLAA
jgi:Family of unknown function (DUF6011)